MSLRPCPAWCEGDHRGDGLDIFHHREIGRISGGELTVVVSLTQWAAEDMHDITPAVTLMWHGSDEADTDVYLQDGIEFELSDTEQLIPLLKQANAFLRTGGQQ